MRFLLPAALAVALLIGSAGCTARTDTADVFPMNAAAQRLGPVQASFVRTGTGRGPLPSQWQMERLWSGNIAWHLAGPSERPSQRRGQLLPSSYVTALFSLWRGGRRRRCCVGEQATRWVTATANAKPTKGPFGRLARLYRKIAWFHRLPWMWKTASLRKIW